jgi:hypothetical protein
MKDFCHAGETAAKATDIEAIEHLRRSVQDGKPWFPALLEAMSLWSSPTEVYRGKTYNYLIAGEAFDWLLLAQRLLDEVNGLVPGDEVAELLLRSKPPAPISRAEFRRLIGHSKYQAYLNYHYGVVVEEAIVLAVELEVRKERHASGWRTQTGVENEAFRRIYDADKNELLHRFREAKGLPLNKSWRIDERKEFTYWLFRYRLAKSEKERFASDTRKGLNYLRHLRARDSLLPH